MAIYPWIEQWATGDKREHHLLDRPLTPQSGPALAQWPSSFCVLLWIGGGNDLIASFFDMSINTITWFLRWSLVRRWYSWLPSASVWACSAVTATNSCGHGDRQHPAPARTASSSRVHALSDEEKAVPHGQARRTPLTMPERSTRTASRCQVPAGTVARDVVELLRRQHPLPTREELEAAGRICATRSSRRHRRWKRTGG